MAWDTSLYFFDWKTNLRNDKQTSCTRYREVSEDNDENHII